MKIICYEYVVDLYKHFVRYDLQSWEYVSSKHCFLKRINRTLRKRRNLHMCLCFCYFDAFRRNYKKTSFLRFLSDWKTFDFLEIARNNNNTASNNLNYVLVKKDDIFKH